MAFFSNKMAFATAALAATAMTAIPAAAAQLPVASSAAHAGAYDSTAENVQNHRYYRGRNRIDGGDVVAGVLVLGAIAAIANSANNNRDRDYRERPVRYREPVPSDRSWGARGMERAVDMCIDQVERGRDRVEGIDNAQRDARGWSVDGTLENGDSFTCQIDNDGRIRAIDIGDGYAVNDQRDYRGAYAEVEARPIAEGQLGDDIYARARLANRAAGNQGYSAQVDADIESDARPAYPGGPLPGEEGYGADDSNYEGDGRYDIAARQ